MFNFRLGVILTTILLIFSLNQNSASAANILDKQEVQKLLEKAYEAQYSLTEKLHSWEDAKIKLSVFMTDELAEELMEEHLFPEEQGYIFYATDFSIYIVPSYSYNEDTKMVYNDKLETIYVYEQFKGTGPVIFDTQHEIVTLKRNEARWIISSISYTSDLPKEIKEGKRLEEVNKEEEVSYIETDKQNKIVTTKAYPTNVDLGSMPTRNKINQHIFQTNRNTYSKSIGINPFYQFVGVVPYRLRFQDMSTTIEQDARLLSRLTLLTIFRGK